MNIDVPNSPSQLNSPSHKALMAKEFIAQQTGIATSIKDLSYKQIVSEGHGGNTGTWTF